MSKENGADPITLTNGQSIQKGDLIAYSYGTSSLAHIHFEIRVGGLYLKNCCNPWKYMPNSANSYSSLNSTLSLTPNYNSTNCEAVVNVSVPPDQLTFARVELHITDTSDQPQEVRFYDMCGANLNHTFAEMDDWEYQDDPSDSSSYVIRISPVKFNSQSYGKNEWASYGFEFINLPALTGSGKVMAKVFDVFGNSNSTAYQTYTCTPASSTDTGNTESAGYTENDPTNTKNDPTDTNNDPTNTNNDPTNTNNDPTNTNNDPTDADTGMASDSSSSSAYSAYIHATFAIRLTVAVVALSYVCGSM